MRKSKKVGKPIFEQPFNLLYVMNNSLILPALQLVLSRKMSFYIVTYYLPSGLFVVVSWISFLVNPEVQKTKKI